MSYPPYQQNQQYGAPPQGHSPQPGYQQPPPQGHSPYPQQQGYGAPPPGQYPPQQGGYGQPPPQGYPPQQGYGQPPQGYPPQHQQQYGQPPQGYPPQQHYGPPPPQQYGQPPQQQYGQPPQQQQYGRPPPGQYGQAPPQGGHGAPPQQQWGAPSMPTPPSPGYGPLTVPLTDPSFAVDTLRKAMKGLGTDDATLIRTLCHYPAPQIPNLNTSYQQRHKRSLEADIKSETSGYFEECLVAILRGPLQQDVWCLNKALKGAGTNEKLLNDVLIGRSNADLNAIKQAYRNTYKRTLETDVASDLSGTTERLFSMILAASRQEDSSPVIPQNIDQDVTELHKATEAKMGTDQLTVCSILSNRSDGQIRAIANAYESKYRTSLEKVIASEFSGHTKAALIQMVRSGTDRAMRDAVKLEDCMAGPGTKDEMLVARVVSMHWNRDHIHQVRTAYKAKYGKDLVSRIKGETSGNYEKMLIAMVE